MWVLINLVAIVLGVFVPAYVLARRLTSPTNLLESALFTVGIGLSVVPTVVFVVAWILGVSYSAPLVFGVSIALTLAARPWGLSLPKKPSREEVLVVLFLIAVVFVAMLITEFHSVGLFRYFDSCLRSIVLYLKQSDGAGWSLFDPESGSYVTYVLNHPAESVLGISPVIEDVRATNGALQAVFMVLAGRAMDEIVTLLMYFILSGSATLIAAFYVSSWRLRLAIGVATLFGLHGVMAYMLNENAFGVSTGTLMLFLLLRRPSRSGELFLAGFLLGFTVGCRLPAIAWLVPVVFALRATSWRSLAIVLGSFLLSFLPWALVYWILRGNPLHLPGQPDVMIQQDFLGISFTTRPLNWPIADSLTRLPEHAIPPLFYIPIHILRSGGSILVAATVLGFASLRSRENLRSPMLVVTTWVAPILGLLLLQRYIDYEKASYLAMTMPAMPLLLASLAARLQKKEQRWLWLVSWAVLAAGLAFVPRLLVGIDVPPDPAAHRDYRVVIPDTSRFEWQNERTHDEERSILGELAFFPKGQDIVYRSELWESLRHAPEGPLFESGRIYVRFNFRGPKDIVFPVKASVEAPTLPEILPTRPRTIREFEIMVFLVHLRVNTGPEPKVRLISSMEDFRIEIDPGPPPHEPRYVSFAVDEQLSDYWYERCDKYPVFVAGERVPSRGLGFRITHEGGEKSANFITVVTNLAIPEQPVAKEDFNCFSERCSYEWMIFRDDGEPDPGPDAPAQVDSYWTESVPPRAVLPIQRPVLYR